MIDKQIDRQIDKYSLLKITLMANSFERFKPFRLNIYFKRAKFTLDLKTKKCLYICIEIKGKILSFEIQGGPKKSL